MSIPDIQLVEHIEGLSALINVWAVGLQKSLYGRDYCFNDATIFLSGTGFSMNFFDQAIIVGVVAVIFCISSLTQSSVKWNLLPSKECHALTTWSLIYMCHSSSFLSYSPRVDFIARALSIYCSAFSRMKG